MEYFSVKMCSAESLLLKLKLFRLKKSSSILKIIEIRQNHIIEEMFD